MKEKSIGFKIGSALAALHLCLAILAFLAIITSRSSTAGLVFVWFYFLDAPLLLLLPSSALKLFGASAPLVQFGIFGSGIWFLIPWLIDLAVSRIFANGSKTVRVIIIAGAIPLILFGFFRLSFFSTTHLVQQERPEELKKMLNHASSDFLTEKIIFEDNRAGSVNSINLMNCTLNAGIEIVLGLTREVVFFNKGYEVQSRLNLGDRGFRTIEPLAIDGPHSCGFIAYRLQEGVSLYDRHGKEILKFPKFVGNAGAVDGVRAGDVDGDGKPEYVLFHRYREGIHLLNGEGKTMWQHPIYALGHLEIADINGDGKAAIIYDSANNFNGVTEFTFLDSVGTVTNQMKISTLSSEFALVRWPNSAVKPNILLTESNKIKIVDFNGSTVVELDAPGCRTFGEVKAVALKIKKEEPAYLAVRKNLHPDISVLYVYNAAGKLVYQKTDVTGGGHASTLAAGPANENGEEKLLVGSSRNYAALVLEYSLTR